MMERAPASAAEPFWEAVHGEPRAPLPGLADFLRVLLDRGRLFEVVLTGAEARRWPSRDAVLLFARRQFWVETGAEDLLLQTLVDARPGQPDGSILDGRRNGSAS